MASIVTVIVLPIWGVADINNSAANIAGMGYQTCTEIAETKPNADIAAEDQRCMDDFTREFIKLRATKTAYVEGVAFAVALCVFAYAVIWACAWVARWVWRGRSTKNTA